ncbi:hypothetical protein R3W88_019723 [Solanum pinnatisectum]|uniref:Transmembrane protein n=1 Tax=Solanum pinnatisectum TaxID=50273 RepID=A0AAV9KK50_9SOLN|nr:hypothetical protein R3W88_019723 [Solanum pinnatisectum]
MNAILESPLEALAFNYWSFNVANIVWTWVAVVTAAVSFWKIKASSSTLPTPPEPTVASSSSQVELMLLSKERTPARNNMMLSDDAFWVKEEGTKGKLTVYFKQDEDGDDDEEKEEDGEEDHGVEWFENNWEKLRKGEMGWYCYQDMKVINGSIVRLWDEQREAQKTVISVSAW